MPNKTISGDRYQQMCAAFKSGGILQVMEEITKLESQGLLNGTAPNGYSPLIAAAACKSLNAVRLLYTKEEVDPNYKNGNETVLTVAIAQDDTKTVEFLIQRGQMQPSSHDKELATRLIKEGKISDKEAMQELLSLSSTPSTQISSSSSYGIHRTITRPPAPC